jgi:two-component system, sensor histidine kinase
VKGSVERVSPLGDAGDRLRRLEALLSLGGEPVALFDPGARVLAAAPALTQAVNRAVPLLDGATLDELGCSSDTANRFRDAIARAAAGEPSVVIADPRLLPGRDIHLTAMRDGLGRIWAVGAAAPPAPKMQVGRFLSAANHDLRQPFQAMHLFHHLLSSRLTEPRMIDFAEKLGHSIAAADHGLGALVLAARLDAGLMVPDRRAFPLALILIPMVEEYRARARDEGLKFRVRFGPASGDAAVTSDQYLLESMLRQLLDNAIRFTETGGVLLGVRPRGAGLRIEVWDSGPGIPDSERHAVWEDFRRLDPPPRNGIAGMGLGLGIVRRISRLLDHPISLRSRVGHGTVAAVDVAAGPV